MDYGERVLSSVNYSVFIPLYSKHITVTILNSSSLTTALMLACSTSLLFFRIAVLSNVTHLGQWEQQQRPRLQPSTACCIPLWLGKRSDQAHIVVHHKWNQFCRHWHISSSITVSATWWTSVSVSNWILLIEFTSTFWRCWVTVGWPLVQKTWKGQRIEQKSGKW